MLMMALEQQLSQAQNPVDGEADGVTNGVEAARPTSFVDGDKTPRLPRWTRQEILVLIQGKRVAETRARQRGRSAGLPFGSGQVEPKWASVSSYCKRHGVNRGPVQCRKRWSNLAGDYKKIKEWESQVKEETESFWVMRNDLRRERKLPGFFDKEVYDILDSGSDGAPETSIPGLSLALAAPGSAAEDTEADAGVLFDSGRTAAVEDGLFSDFELDESGRSRTPEKEAPPVPKEVPAPTPISEKQYQPVLRSCQGQGLEDAPKNEAKRIIVDSQSIASQSKATPLPLKNTLEDVLSLPQMMHKLTTNPTTRAYLQNNDFVRMMHNLHNIYLKDRTVIQALGVLLNINFWTPTSLKTEMPESLSFLSLMPERKGDMEAEPVKELDLMELTVEEGMDSGSQACKEQELGNAAYTKNDFDTAIAHYTKVVELDDGHISCLMNRAVAYLAMGQYEECIKDCDKAVERGRQLKSDSKMIAIALTRKGTVLVKMAKLSKDYELAIQAFQKALLVHHNPDTLKKLNDAEKSKRELEQQEYFDTKLADEEHEKEEKSEKHSEIEEIGNVASHTRQPEVIQVEEMQPQALSTLKPRGVVFDVEAVKILKPSEQMEFLIEDDDMELEACEQHGLFITQGSEKSEKQIVSKAHGMVFDVEAVKMNDSGEQNKPEIEEIGNVALHTRQPEVIQVEEMQPQALSTLKPQGVVFDDEAVKILKPSGQMEFQIEDDDMELEACEQHGLFIKQGGLVFTKPTKDEDWKHAKEIYLMDNEVSVLPENPRCLNLSALFLPRNYKLRVIPPSFFDYMPTLQILNLSRTSIKSLPDSLFQLVSLERLFLNDCHRLMMLSPKVGDLKKLEVLDLEGAKIMNLPKEIKKLTNLICLEVSFYGYTGNGRRSMQSDAVVPCGVICSLSQLEELNIDVNPDDERWDTRVEDIVNEVCNLKRLETFKFYFPRVELLRHFQWNSLSLSHFRFTVGHHVKRIMSRVPLDVEFELERWERCLKYINGVGVPRDIKNVLQHATAFFLDRHATVKKLSDFGTRNMKQIKCCVVGECNEVEMIIDTADAYGEDGISEIVSESHDAERIVLGSLEYLYIYYMKSLRSIWEGPVPQNSLYLLKSLTLRTCPQLTTIFTQELLDNLCSLEELKVEDCPSIKSIVSCKIPAEHRTSYFLPNLKKISLHYMLGLVSICSGLHIAPKLEWLSFYNCPSLSNPLINEVSSHDLKKIKGERSWWEALEWSNGRPDYLDKIFVPIDIWDC